MRTEARARRAGSSVMLLTGMSLSLVGGLLVAPPASAAGAERASYVVTLDPDVPDAAAAAQDLSRRHGGSVGHVYRHALHGFSVTLPLSAASALARDGRVSAVERDQLFTAVGQTTPSGIRRTHADDNTALDIDGRDDLRVDVDIAIIDTGLDSDHPDLHIAGGTDCSGGSPLRGKCTDGTYEDGNGHGTHVGGTAAALDDGVGVVGMAPGARLHGVKVLSDSGSGYTSWIIAGIDWVTAHNTDGDGGNDIEVANMSLGCECSSAAQDEAIANSVAKGVTYAVAAGNSAKDSATFSPANHPDVITVSALSDSDGEAGGAGGSPTCRTGEADDTLASFSNFGPSVEIAAPGVCILSTWIGGGTHTISGTSMASPHAAGAAALLAATGTYTPDQVRDTLMKEGNSLWTDQSDDGEKEPLLDVSDSAVFAPRTVSGTDGGGSTEPPPGDTAISLTATGSKSKGVQQADLAWTGGTSTSVDVHRNDVKVATTANDGDYTDAIGQKGGGTYTYKVCEAGTATCSNDSTVTF